ncbi:ATP-binding protein [Parasedimentitalea denitrificans]|uniref:ATP-binding protein n=1 Tax=Parasedimentitalea denitrificans TaxID=2211118 RepID=UPI0014319E81|nr:ATP-binding protein [Sedimentitalea sp. CY04]
MKLKNVRIPNQIKSLKMIDEVLKSINLGFNRVELDFRWCSFAEPFPLLYLASRIRQFRLDNPDVELGIILPKNTEKPFLGYARHIGFFDFIGIEEGRKVGEVTGSSNFFPITVWDINKVREEAGDRPVAEKVDEFAAEMAKVLMQTDKGDIFDLVQFSIREIVRNSMEHSQGTECVFLGQYWPQSGEAEIVAMDNGVGISETLWDNEYVDFENNLAGLKIAIFPGISGVSRDERFSQDDYWGNSGFGLYILSEIFGKFGEFHILSNGDHLKLSNRKQFHHAFELRGTAVSVRFPTNSLKAAKSEFSNIIERGEKLRSVLLQDFPVQASTASKMLRSQFRKPE